MGFGNDRQASITTNLYNYIERSFTGLIKILISHFSKLQLQTLGDKVKDAFIKALQKLDSCTAIEAFRFPVKFSTSGVYHSKANFP